MSVLAIETRDARRSRLSRLTRAISPSWFGVLGPAFAVSIGYVDPGNWATDLAAGSYGYRLVWVALIANAIALVLQLAVSDLTLASGSDFGTTIVRRWPRAKRSLLVAFGGAAVATDVAEFTGIVLGLQLLLHLPTPIAVAAGIAVVFAILRATDTLTKSLEIGSIVALACIASACFAQAASLHPGLAAMARGAFVPTVPGGSLVVIVGIVGATVMPHNLFLHSALVRRSIEARPERPPAALARVFGRETFVALNVAAVVNVALISIGAAVEGANGSLSDAFRSLQTAGSIAALLFGGGLLLSGIAASTTATAAGEAIFASFAPRSCSRFARRSLTLLPAAALLVLGCNTVTMLLWSQVALALVLPVALVPLVFLLVNYRRAMRRGTAVALAAGAVSLVCVAFDAVMIVQMFEAART